MLRRLEIGILLIFHILQGIASISTELRLFDCLGLSGAKGLCKTPPDNQRVEIVGRNRTTSVELLQIRNRLQQCIEANGGHLSDIEQLWFLQKLLLKCQFCLEPSSLLFSGRFYSPSVFNSYYDIFEVFSTLMMLSFRDSLVKRYFDLGMHHYEIIAFLKILHNITLSLRHLKRILRRLGLFRRKQYTNIQTIINFIDQETNKAGQLHGYRWMHRKCLQQGYVVTQEVIRLLLQIIDPFGVQFRRRKRLRRRQYINKGPNYVWHMDSYDKLKPYGICINGCIDGYSRYIIWLRGGVTSSDPKIVAGYYLTAVETLGGCPVTVRSDMGTENGITEKFQEVLRESFDTRPSQRPAFMYGKSPANQRIESWWSILRKHNAQFWMNLFHLLKEDGLFNGDFLDKSLIQFCFLELIQNELDQLVVEWNSHSIRHSRNAVSPSGRPITMYEVPILYNTINYLIPFSEDVVEIFKQQCTFHKYPCDKDVFDICSLLMVDKGFEKCDDPYDTVQLYINLRQELRQILEI